MTEDSRSIIIKTYVEWVAELLAQSVAYQARLKELSDECMSLTEERDALLRELSLIKGPEYVRS